MDLERIGFVVIRHSHVRLYVGSPRFYSGNFDNDDHHMHGIYATFKISTPTIAVIELTRAGDRCSISDHYIVLHQQY